MAVPNSSQFASSRPCQRGNLRCRTNRRVLPPGSVSADQHHTEHHEVGVPVSKLVSLIVPIGFSTGAVHLAS